MTEDDIRGMLRELRDDPVPPDSLARVRLAVDDRLTRRSRMPWWVAAFATLGLAMVAFLLRPSAPLLTPAFTPSPAPVVAYQLTPVPPVPVNVAKRSPAARKQRIRPSALRNSEPMVIRIETPDPDVVILLVGD